MSIRVPASEIDRFARVIGTDGYLRQERNYKLLAHKVVSALLADQTLARPDFPDLLADVLSADAPDLDALGLDAGDRREADRLLKESDVASFKGALANLAGGRWGLAQFMWIPRAVEFDLGEELREAFRALVDPGDPVSERVDRFRDDLYAVQQRLQEKGGFLPKWHLLRVSLNFVGALLGAYDPGAYTFYAYRPLRRAFEDFGGEWPQGTAGEKYGVVCKFVAAVADALREGGVPVQDLIDAQSFIYIRSIEAPPRAGAPAGMPDAAPAVEAVDRETVTKDLAQAIGWPLERARKLVNMATRWRQLLFQGPPGTGKTYVAETLVRVLTGDEEERVEVVQFHPSHAYEDFVEGIRPKVTEDAAGLRYEVRAGVFLDLVERAKERPDSLFFIVIDEMNRANLPRVLGELLYALEYRGKAHPFRLPYSGRETYIPENIIVIGTMNSADRSIALVDAAIRRRFRHVDFEPDPEVLRRWLQGHGLGDMAELATARLTALNEKLLDLLDRDRLIGHTYLMRPDLREAGLEAVWVEDVEPVLREHLYGQPEEIEALRAVFLGA